MTKLAPSILSADFCTLGEDIRQIEAGVQAVLNAAVAGEQEAE